jgi:hypothetical protein
MFLNALWQARAEPSAGTAEIGQRVVDFLVGVDHELGGLRLVPSDPR